MQWSTLSTAYPLSNMSMSLMSCSREIGIVDEEATDTSETDRSLHRTNNEKEGRRSRGNIECNYQETDA